jgi:hypothetical protein
MTDKQEMKRKKTVAADAPIHTIRAGSVSASIWRRQSPAGYVYLDFSLSRSFESLSSGNTGHSKNFFARNRHELTQVIEQATIWIEQQESISIPKEKIAA